jgi:hypothetical protein
MSLPPHHRPKGTTVADGLDWLLNRAGIDQALIAHMWHLDDDEPDPDCLECTPASPNSEEGDRG